MEEVKYCPSCGAYLPCNTDKCLACGWPEKKPEKDDNAIETTLLSDSRITISSIPKTPQEVLRTHVDTVKKEFFTVMLGGKKEVYYITKSDMEIGNTIYHSKDMFGKIIEIERGKKKLHLTLIER